MLHLVVGNKNYSSWSLRAWLALAEIGAPFDETVIPLYVDNWSEKILKHSKAGLVPILHDGDVTIWILGHLRVPGGAPPRIVAGRGPRPRPCSVGVGGNAFGVHRFARCHTNEPARRWAQRANKP